MMWEYTQVVWIAKKDPKFIDWLNLLGQDRWQFCAFAQSAINEENGAIMQAFCIFKREFKVELI